MDFAYFLKKLLALGTFRMTELRLVKVAGAQVGPFGCLVNGGQRDLRLQWEVINLSLSIVDVLQYLSSNRRCFPLHGDGNVVDATLMT